MGLWRPFSSSVGLVADVLFPPACWASGEAVDGAGGLSETVRIQIAQLASQAYCPRCGLTTGPFAPRNGALPCGRCEARDAGVVRLARIGTFSEPLVGLVHRLKFGRAWEVAEVLAPFLYQAMLTVSEETGVPVEVTAPVPLHWLRQSRRGFNQSEELARATGRLAGWPVRMALKRVRRTRAQAQIQSPTQRKDNLRGAFVCQRDRTLAGKHVWLVDDVSTTGATIHAAATALRKLPREFRPASINAAVVCITDHNSPPAISPVT